MTPSSAIGARDPCWEIRQPWNRGQVSHKHRPLSSRVSDTEVDGNLFKSVVPTETKFLSQKGGQRLISDDILKNNLTMFNTQFWSENLIGGNHPEELGIDENIIL
jgi:hypothetical protein